MERNSFFLVFCLVLGLVSVNFSECNNPDRDSRTKDGWYENGSGEEVGDDDEDAMTTRSYDIMMDDDLTRARSPGGPDARRLYADEILGRGPQPGDCVVAHKELDLLFLVDVGVHVPFKAIPQVKEFIKTTLKIFDVEAAKTRVSIIVSGDSNSPVLVLLTLEQGVSHRRIQLTLDNWQKQGSGSFQLVPILNNAFEITLTPPVRDVPRIIIIVTASPLTLSQQLSTSVQQLTNNNFHLFVVSVGINDFGFQSLVSNPSDHLVELSYFELATAVRINKTITSIPEYGCDVCIPNPCKNNGICYLQNLIAACHCIQPYTGPLCTTLDPCGLNSCPSYTICQPNGNTYICAEKSCQSNSCLNGGSCVKTGNTGAISCECTKYYVGPTCEHRCPYCYNGGVCRYSTQQATCLCPSGYEGQTCNTRIEPCVNYNCPTGLVCKLGVDGSAQCVNPCDALPCDRPHGTCVLKLNGEAVCVCLNEGGVPPTCTGQVNPCANVVCNNGGICVANGEVGSCHCANTYTGPTCDIHPCDNWYKCLNGGTCAYNAQLHRPNCICTPQYTGIDCSELKCNCQNQGTCTLVNGVNTCSCPEPYYGNNCELVNRCLPSPCQNGGTCQNLPNTGSYACECVLGYYGSTCSLELVSCTTIPKPCLNGATCVQLSTERYTCVCAEGFTGSSCSKIPDPCSSNLCQNNTQCVPNNLKAPYYICQCTTDYTGPYCNISSKTGENPCSSSPCTAPCICKESCQHAEGYICESSEGFLGKQCTIPPPELICERDLITVKIPNQMYLELTGGSTSANAFFYLGLDENSQPANNCKATVSGGFHILTIPSQFTDCQTTSMTSQIGDVSVVNNVWFNLHSHLLFDIPVPVFSIRCNYSTHAYDIVTSLRPIIDSIDRSISGITNKQYGGELQLCKNVGTCSSTCPSNLLVQPGAVYTIGQYINVIIEPSSIQNPSQPIVLDHFFISCDDVASATNTVAVVTDGCATSQLLGTVSRSSTATCVTFKVHRLLACTTIYLHAKLKICPSTPTECTSSSGLQCNSVKVGKRSLSTNFKRSANEQIFGPIFIIPAPQYNNTEDFDIKKKKIIIKEAKLGNAQNKSIHFSLMIILGSLVGVIIILLVFVSVSLYCSYRKNTG